jgi:glycosyltransferase involved in cell wall biosynthesis
LGVKLAQSHGLRRGIPAAALAAQVPDPNWFKPAQRSIRRDLRVQLGLPLYDVVVGYIGRLEPEKGILDLLAAAALVRSSDFFVGVWGLGSLRERVDASLGENRSVRGRFLGALDLRMVADAMRACDIVVVPSRAECNEQFSRVAVEAMSCGCALVATQSGALADVVADGGLLVEANDVRALANALQHLVCDPDQRLLLGARARERFLLRFSPQAIAQAAIEFWSEVASR